MREFRLFAFNLFLKVRIRARNRRGWSPLSKLLEFETTFQGDNSDSFLLEISLLVSDKETVQMFWPEGFNRAQSFSLKISFPLLLLTSQLLSQLIWSVTISSVFTFLLLLLSKDRNCSKYVTLGVFLQSANNFFWLSIFGSFPVPSCLSIWADSSIPKLTGWYGRGLFICQRNPWTGTMRVSTCHVLFLSLRTLFLKI